jgi:ubiquinone/menaquinone biosynthesis C-methylase UbiE
VTPLEYAAWRRSRLGGLTEALEVSAVLRAAGDVSGRNALDIGSGDGLYSVALAGRGAKVGGLDRSVSALQAARERATAAGVRVVLAAGDATALPFAGATFELVTAVTVLCFIPAPGEAAREVARVLRPGGVPLARGAEAGAARGVLTDSTSCGLILYSKEYLSNPSWSRCRSR